MDAPITRQSLLYVFARLVQIILAIPYMYSYVYITDMPNLKLLVKPIRGECQITLINQQRKLYRKMRVYIFHVRTAGLLFALQVLKAAVFSY